MKLDLSQFHDLMHLPFTRHCRSLYPRGWSAGIHHLTLAWEYRYRDLARAPLHVLLCRLGRHEVMVWYSHPADGGPVRVRPVCRFCPFERPPTQAEIASEPPFTAPHSRGDG